MMQTRSRKRIHTDNCVALLLWLPHEIVLLIYRYLNVQDLLLLLLVNRSVYSSIHNADVWRNRMIVATPQTTRAPQYFRYVTHLRVSHCTDSTSIVARRDTVKILRQTHLLQKLEIGCMYYEYLRALVHSRAYKTLQWLQVERYILTNSSLWAQFTHLHRLSLVRVTHNTPQLAALPITTLLIPFEYFEHGFKYTAAIQAATFSQVTQLTLLYKHDLWVDRDVPNAVIQSLPRLKHIKVREIGSLYADTFSSAESNIGMCSNCVNITWYLPLTVFDISALSTLQNVQVLHLNSLETIEIIPSINSLPMLQELKWNIRLNQEFDLIHQRSYNLWYSVLLQHCTVPRIKLRYLPNTMHAINPDHVNTKIKHLTLCNGIVLVATHTKLNTKLTLHLTHD